MSNAKAHIDANLGLVVFGKDEAGKPHASVFAAADAELAAKAARLMGMQVMRPVSEAARALALKLPKGRVFASGRGFVPFVKPKVHEALIAAYADPANQPTAGDTSGEALAGHSTVAGERPAAVGPGVGDIGEGAVVLAPAGPLEGWWEAVVIKVKGDLLTLRWRDFPDDPVIARRRKQLALFDVAAVPAAK